MTCGNLARSMISRERFKAGWHAQSVHPTDPVGRPPSERVIQPGNTHGPTESLHAHLELWCWVTRNKKGSKGRSLRTLVNTALLLKLGQQQRVSKQDRQAISTEAASIAKRYQAIRRERSPSDQRTRFVGMYGRPQSGREFKTNRVPHVSALVCYNTEKQPRGRENGSGVATRIAESPWTSTPRRSAPRRWRRKRNLLE